MSLVFGGLSREISLFCRQSNFLHVTSGETQTEGNADRIRVKSLFRTRNALVKVGSEPANHDPERTQSAPKSDRTRKRTGRFNVSIQTGRQSSRQSLSEVLTRQESDGARKTLMKRTSEGPQGVANEEGESSARPLASFARSKSQSALWNAITAGMGIKGKDHKAFLNDPRSPEEILADELPAADEPDATEKTAIRLQWDTSSHAIKPTLVKAAYHLLICLIFPRLTPALAAAAGSQNPTDIPCAATTSITSLTSRLMSFCWPV